MQKLIQKIEKLKNKNSSDMSFDFLKKDKAIKKDNKSSLKKIVTFFLFSQLMFGLANMNNLLNYVDTRNVETNNIYNNYKKIQNFSQSGKQEETVAAYINMVKSREPINDLLAGGFVLILLTKDDLKTDITLTEEDKKLEEDYRIKLTPETTKTIVNIYKENWKNGIKAQKDQYNNYNCMIIDLSCFGLKSIYEKKVMKQVNSIENKVNVTNYNIEHVEEFLIWQRKTMEIINKNSKLPEKERLTIPDNPGKKAFPYKY